MKEKMKVNRFLKMEAFTPRYLNSKGNVAMPTVVRVDMKIAICIIPAPFFNNTEAIGKTMKTGISVNEPTKEEITIPENPD